MIKRLFLVVTLAGIIFLMDPRPAQAGRTRKPRSIGAQPASALTYSMGVRAWVRFRPDRRAILLSFSGFDNLQSGSYDFSYTANGIGQGTTGSVILGDTDTKTLLFGTCSGGVCTYHTNITDAYLTITSVLKDGRKVVKPYRLKV